MNSADVKRLYAVGEVWSRQRERPGAVGVLSHSVCTCRDEMRLKIDAFIPPSCGCAAVPFPCLNHTHTPVEAPRFGFFATFLAFFGTVIKRLISAELSTVSVSVQ